MILPFSAGFFSSFHLLELEWQAAVASCPRVISSLSSFLPKKFFVIIGWDSFLSTC